MLEPLDEEVRGALTRRIARLGYAPAAAAIGEEVGKTAAEVEQALRRLPWRKRRTEDIRALFERHGLVGPFWSMG